MSDWWTYRLSDFLLFAPRTYWRQFELMNQQWWPLQWPLLAAGLVLAFALWRGVPRLAGAPVVLAWALSAWAFLWQRYAGIHWLAPWFAAAFVLQALLLAVAFRRATGVRSGAGALWVLAAVLGYPLLGALAGRPWSQAELFGLAPDATVLASFGALLSPRRAWLWPIPLAWSAIAGATRWAMEDPFAALLPAGALLALAGAAFSSRTGRAPPAPCPAARP